MSDLYILDENGNPLRTESIQEWGAFFEDRNKRRVALDVFEQDGQDITVSTVFLGMDHSWSPKPHDPVLWETMIFGGPRSEWQDRYTSKGAALEGHQRAVLLAKLPYSEDQTDEPIY